MKLFEVISPEIWEIIPVLDFGQGPIEYYKCYTTIYARNKHEAKILSIKTDDMRKWVMWQRGDGCCPFTGLEINEIKSSNALCEVEY